MFEEIFVDFCVCPGKLADYTRWQGWGTWSTQRFAKCNFVLSKVEDLSSQDVALLPSCHEIHAFCKSTGHFWLKPSRQKCSIYLICFFIVLLFSGYLWGKKNTVGDWGFLKTCPHLCSDIHRRNCFNSEVHFCALRNCKTWCEKMLLRAGHEARPYGWLQKGFRIVDFLNNYKRCWSKLQELRPPTKLWKTSPSKSWCDKACL